MNDIRNAEILKEYRKGNKISSLAKQYNLSSTTITKIIRRQSYIDKLSSNELFIFLNNNSRAYNSLFRNGIKSVDDLKNCEPLVLKEFKGMGDKSFDYIMNLMSIECDINRNMNTSEGMECKGMENQKESSSYVFSSKEHESFYFETLKKCRYIDAYHNALIYCLGISEVTRSCIDRIYDFKTGNLKLECTKEGWQTGSSLKVTRLAFNLYNDGEPTVFDIEDRDKAVSECGRYSVSDIFCCSYAPFFYQAVCIRYPEYTNSQYSLE